MFQGEYQLFSMMLVVSVVLLPNGRKMSENQRYLRFFVELDPRTEEGVREVIKGQRCQDIGIDCHRFECHRPLKHDVFSPKST